MLEIIVNLVPLGNYSNKEILGIGHIINNGKGTSKKGEYDFTYYTKGKEVYRGQIKNHNREESIWRLVKKTLEYFEEDLDRNDLGKDNLEKVALEFINALRKEERKNNGNQ